MTAPAALRAALRAGLRIQDSSGGRGGTEADWIGAGGRQGDSRAEEGGAGSEIRVNLTKNEYNTETKMRFAWGKEPQLAHPPTSSIPIRLGPRYLFAFEKSKLIQVKR